ncbi:MAG: hypothetical protein J5750_02940, partial [Clostridiales bacterium]|nr:hypothetical protein [Clostridiales bacterium]
GEILNGEAYGGAGGNLYNTAAATLTITGGKIAGGKAASGGSAISNAPETTYSVSGGEIEGEVSVRE